LKLSNLPISNILESSVVREYLEHNIDSSKYNRFFIGDYGSGRNAEVPLFFTKEYQFLVSHEVPKSLVYCIDMHILRLENMFGQFREEGITSNARVVQAKLETMQSNATFPYEQEEYLIKRPHELTSLDKQILNEKRLPSSCFHLGIMNKDLVGYLSKYYENDADITASFQSIRETLRSDALLIVTQPCVMYRVDNLKILRDNSFHLKEIIDVDLKTGTHTQMNEPIDFETFSRLNHYSFIVLSTK
jgi:hypothetical protein